MDISKVKSVAVLGTGCRNCKKMLASAAEAMKELGLQGEPEYITDMEKIMSYGIMLLPCLAVNGKIVSQGKVLSAKEITDVIIKTVF
ncbi:MAG: thioredoxin family protein [Bullifex sp.]